MCFSVSKPFLKALKAYGCAMMSLFVLYIFYFFFHRERSELFVTEIS